MRCPGPSVAAQTITANAYASLVERLTETQETQTQVSIMRLLNTLRRIASPAEAEEFVRDFDAKDGRKTFYVRTPPSGASKALWNAVSHSLHLAWPAFIACMLALPFSGLRIRSTSFKRTATPPRKPAAAPTWARRSWRSRTCT